MLGSGARGAMLVRWTGGGCPSPSFCPPRRTCRCCRPARLPARLAGGAAQPTASRPLARGSPARVRSHRTESPMTRSGPSLSRIESPTTTSRRAHRCPRLLASVFRSSVPTARIEGMQCSIWLKPRHRSRYCESVPGAPPRRRLRFKKAISVITLNDVLMPERKRYAFLCVDMLSLAAGER